MSISNYEISIIKGMLRMEYKAAIIQAYFTRPDRLVNPARIYEIRDGTYKGSSKVKAATDDEVGTFIDDHHRHNSPDEAYSPPEQDRNVFQFRLDENGRLTTLSDGSDLELNDPQIREIYNELRAKSLDFSQLGHNSLAGLNDDATKFAAALPENPEDASAVVLFMKGSGLKSKLASYQASKENPDLYPLVELDEAVYPLFEDLMHAFSLLVNLSPVMAILEQKSSSLEVYKDQGDALEAIKPAIDEAKTVADEEAASAIEDQINSGLQASDDPHGRAQRSIAFSSVRNFTIAVFSPIYRAARYVLGDEKLPSIMKTVRNTAAGKATADLYNYVGANFPAIVEYIRVNVDALASYANSVISNPHLQDFVKMIIELIKGAA
jgi:hypothetical protein